VRVVSARTEYEVQYLVSSF